MIEKTLDEKFNDALDAVYGSFRMCGIEFKASDIFKKCAPDKWRAVADAFWDDEEYKKRRGGTRAFVSLPCQHSYFSLFPRPSYPNCSSV